MKVLLPFWDMAIIDRYRPQFEALSDEVSQLVILYIRGDPPEDWASNIVFLKSKIKKRGHKYLDWWFGKDEISKTLPHDLDIIYSLSGLWMNIYGQAIADHFKIPHLIRIRGSMIETRKYNGKGRLQNMLFGRVHTECFKNATLVTSIVQKYLPWLREIGLKEHQIGEVIPNGISLKDWTVKHPLKFTPGYAGRISKEKGSEFLEDLIKCTPEYSWIITGDIQDADFTVPPNCAYLGKTPFAEMDEFYNQVSLLVQPSFTEGFPNIILEAFVNEKLVIGSTDAYPEEVHIFGNRLELDMMVWISSLHQHSKRTLENRRLYGEHARRYVKRYTWEAHGKGIKAQLEKAIKIYDPL